MQLGTKAGTKNIHFFTSQIVSGCQGSIITFSLFLGNFLTITPANMSQPWGYLCQPCLWEGMSLVYMKFYFKISRRIFLVTDAGSHMKMFREQLSIIQPQQQQTHWQRSTWSDSPTWLCNFLKKRMRFHKLNKRDDMIKRHLREMVDQCNRVWGLKY